MPGYRANRSLTDIPTLQSFTLDATDEDMLGAFMIKASGNSDTSYEIYVWRKNSNADADGDRVIDGTQGKFIKHHSVVVGDFGGNVVGNVEPIHAPMLLVDRNSTGNSPLLYYAPTTSKFSWVLLSSPVRVTSNSDPNKAPDFEGQMWVNKSDGTMFIGTDVNSEFGWLKFTAEPVGTGS